MNPDLIQLILIIAIFSLVGAYLYEEATGVSIHKATKHYYNEALYTVGLKKRPKREAFVGKIVKIFIGIGKILTNVLGLAKFFVNLSTGTLFLVTGAIMAVSLSIMSIMKGFWEWFVLTLYIIEFSLSHLFCFMKILFTAPSCLLWYALETFGKILYLCTFGLLIGIMALFGIDLKPAEAAMWRMLMYLDRIVFGLIGYHFLHFPRWVRDLCYNCKRLKTSTVGSQFARLSEVVLKDVPNDAKPGLSLMEKGGSQFIDALKFIKKALG